jgi:hypothetical protein
MTLLREEWTGFSEAASAPSVGRNSALQIVAREKRAFMSFGTVDQNHRGTRIDRCFPGRIED